MKNIRFIKKITDYVVGRKAVDKVVIGNCVYYNLANGNKVKLWCYERGVGAEVINKMDGKVDSVDFPFANYFKPTQCSSNAPQWTQRIDGNEWYFERVYKHVLPKESDYMKLAEALELYIAMYA